MDNNTPRNDYLRNLLNKKTTLQQSGSLLNPAINDEDSYNLTQPQAVSQAETEKPKDEGNFFKNTYDDAVSLIENATHGFIGWFEGIGDMVLGLGGTVASWFGADTSGLNDFIAHDWTGDLTGGIASVVTGNGWDTDWQGTLDTNVGKFLGDVSFSIGNMLPSILLTGGIASGAGLSETAAKALGTGLMAAGAVGKGTEEALNDGAENLGTAVGYGALSGAAEFATEYIPFPGGNKTAGVLGKGAKNVSKSLVKEIGKEMVEEGLEEVASEFVSPFVKAVYKGKVEGFLTEEHLHDIAYSFASGAVSGGVMSGFQAGANKINENRLKKKISPEGFEIVKELEDVNKKYNVELDEVRKGNSLEGVDEKLTRPYLEEITPVLEKLNNLPMQYKEAILEMYENPKTFKAELENAKTEGKVSEFYDKKLKSFNENMTRSMSDRIKSDILGRFFKKTGKSSDIITMSEQEWNERISVQDAASFLSDGTMVINPKYLKQFGSKVAHELVWHNWAELDSKAKRAIIKAIENTSEFQEILDRVKADTDYQRQAEQSENAEEFYKTEAAPAFIEKTINSIDDLNGYLSYNAASRIKGFLRGVAGLFKGEKGVYDRAYTKIQNALSKIKGVSPEQQTQVAYSKDLVNQNVTKLSDKQYIKVDIEKNGIDFLERIRDEVPSNNAQTEVAFYNFEIKGLSNILKNIGVNVDSNKPITMNRTKLHSVLSEIKDTKKNIHKLTPNQFINGVKSVNDPLFVTKNVNGNYAAFTEITDNDNNLILCAFNFNDSQKHIVVTVYGKNLTENFFDKNKIIYKNDNKLKKNIAAKGVQFSPLSNVLKNILEDNTNEVNTKYDTKVRYSKDLDSLGNELTKEQANFFKDTAVRDESGNLLATYHLTNKDFTVFNDRKFGSGAGQVHGNGFYFFGEGLKNSAVDSKLVGYMPKGRVIRSYLNITKPFYSYDKLSIEDYKKFCANSMKEDIGVFEKTSTWKNLKKLYELSNNNGEMLLAYQEYVDNNNEFSDTRIGLKSLGYDGVIIDRSKLNKSNKKIFDTDLYDDSGKLISPSNLSTYYDQQANYTNEYIVFDSNQVKYRRTTSPTTNEDIRFSKDLLVGQYNLGDNKQKLYVSKTKDGYQVNIGGKILKEAVVDVKAKDTKTNELVKVSEKKVDLTTKAGVEAYLKDLEGSTKVEKVARQTRDTTQGFYNYKDGDKTRILEVKKLEEGYKTIGSETLEFKTKEEVRKYLKDLKAEKSIYRREAPVINKAPSVDEMNRKATENVKMTTKVNDKGEMSIKLGKVGKNVKVREGKNIYTYENGKVFKNSYAKEGDIYRLKKVFVDEGSLEEVIFQDEQAIKNRFNAIVTKSNKKADITNAIKNSTDTIRKIENGNKGGVEIADGKTVYFSKTGNSVFTQKFTKNKNGTYNIETTNNKGRTWTTKNQSVDKIKERYAEYKWASNDLDEIERKVDAFKKENSEMLKNKKQEERASKKASESKQTKTETKSKTKSTTKTETKPQLKKVVPEVSNKESILKKASRKIRTSIENVFNTGEKDISFKGNLDDLVNAIINSKDVDEGTKKVMSVIKDSAFTMTGVELEDGITEVNEFVRDEDGTLEEKVRSLLTSIQDPTARQEVIDKYNDLQTLLKQRVKEMKDRLKYTKSVARERILLAKTTRSNLSWTGDAKAYHTISLLGNLIDKLYSSNGQYYADQEFVDELNTQISEYTAIKMEGSVVPFNPEYARLLGEIKNSLPALKEVTLKDGSKQIRGIALDSITLKNVRDLALVLKKMSNFATEKAAKQFAPNAVATQREIGSLRDKSRGILGMTAKALKAINPKWSQMRLYLGVSPLASKVTTELNMAISSVDLYAGNENYKVDSYIREHKIEKALTNKYAVNGFEITGDEFVYLYNTLHTQSNFEAVNESGIDFESKGKRVKLIGKGKAEALLTEVDNTMPSELKDYAVFLKEQFNGELKKDYIDWYVNKYGIEVNDVEDYWQLSRYTERENNITNAVKTVGIFKRSISRTNNTVPVRLLSATSVFRAYTSEMGKQLYLTPLYEEIVSTINSKVDGNRTLKSYLQEAIGVQEYQYIMDTINDAMGLKEGSKRNFADILTSGFTLKSLSFNVGSWAKQFASMWTSNLPFKEGTKAAAKKLFNSYDGKFQESYKRLVDNIGAVKYRSGVTEAELNTSTLSKIQIVGKKGMGGITKVDYFTICTGVAALMEIGETIGGYEIGSTENEQFVIDHYNEFIMTQIGNNALAKNEISQGGLARYIFGYLQGANRAAVGSQVNKFLTWERNRGLNLDQLTERRAETEKIAIEDETAYNESVKNLDEVVNKLREEGISLYKLGEQDEYKKAIEERDLAEEKMIKSKSDFAEADTKLKGYREYQIMGGNKILVNMAIGLVAQGIFVTLINEVMKHLRGKKDWDDWFGVETIGEVIMNTTVGWIPVVNVVTNYLVKGYDMEVASATVLTDALDLLKYGFDLASGKADGKDALMKICDATSNITGIPLETLYGYVTGMVRLVDPEKAIAMRDFAYGYSYNSSMSQLKDYIDKGNEKSAERQFNYLMDNYKVSNSSESINKELFGLYSSGYEALPKSYMTSYTDEDGNKVDLSQNQIKTFRATYDKSTEDIKTLTSSFDYKSQTDENKAKLTTKIYNAYYEYARATTLNEEPTSRLGKLLYYTKGKVKLANYVSYLNKIASITDSARKTRKQLVIEYVNKLSINSQQKLLLLHLAGYTSTSANNNVLIKFLMSQGMSKEQANNFIS